jgi:beta-lactamase class A
VIFLLKKVTLLLLLAISPLSVSAASLPPREVINELKQFDGTVGFYAKNLKTSKTITYGQDTVFPTASTSKLVVAMAVYKYMYDKAPDAKKDRYSSDIGYMMRISDNDSFYELLDEIQTVKPDALKQVTKDLRLKQTRIHNEDAFKKYQYHSVTTPYEMAKVFESINSERYLGREKSLSLKNNLANTIFHDEIPRYMQTPVMHKVGQLDDVLCDVGIFDDGRDQILVSVYTIAGNSDYASDFIAKVAAKAYNALRTSK